MSEVFQCYSQKTMYQFSEVFDSLSLQNYWHCHVKAIHHNRKVLWVKCLKIQLTDERIKKNALKYLAGVEISPQEAFVCEAIYCSLHTWGSVLHFDWDLPPQALNTEGILCWKFDSRLIPRSLFLNPFVCKCSFLL